MFLPDWAETGREINTATILQRWSRAATNGAPHERASDRGKAGGVAQDRRRGLPRLRVRFEALAGRAKPLDAQEFQGGSDHLTMRRDGKLVTSRRHLRVGTKLWAAVGVSLAALVVVGLVGVVGLRRVDHQTRQIFADSLVSTAKLSDLSRTISAIDRTELERVVSGDPYERLRLDHEITDRLIPRATELVHNLRARDATEQQFGPDFDRLNSGLAKYADARQAAAVTPIADRTNESGALLHPLINRAERMLTDEVREAGRSARQAQRTYDTTRSLLVLVLLAALAGTLVLVTLVLRNLVPRVREYSTFAQEMAAGQRDHGIQPTGNDELSDLGRALNGLREELLSKAAHSDAVERAQAEFAETLQLTATEEEAHELVQHHIERSVTDSATVVLSRNNSANRLEPSTALDSDGDLASRLVGAEPRSCLALRFARTHEEGADPPPLLRCALCRDHQGFSTCEPLLVGGEIIGSVLVACERAIDDDEVSRIKKTVTQAAPVLANLRNLALAEFRANNDALTGLPNRRATDDTLKRMVAQASRSVTPLAAAMLDLDHFKQINDRFGHGKGDEVLAAVGAAIQASLRVGDFAGRFGGEEFLILLPDTGLEGAHQVAEKLRRNVATVTFPGVERPITASIGVADLLEHAGTATELVRVADRALFAAKAAGRDQVVAATNDDDADAPTPMSAPT